MISTATTTFTIVLLVFVALLLLVRAEKRRGRRFFASSLRDWLDDKTDRLGSWIVRSWEHFVKYIVQLNWYYSIHGVLRTFLRGIVAMYTYFESMFERNRARTKQLRREKRELHELNHLRQMAQHKEETALTPAEQRKLRKKKLEEKF